jgi:hypothetical protein
MRPITDFSIRACAAGRATLVTARHRLRRRLAATRSDDRGEGVISAALVVLIMAAIGALMWVAFREIWEGVEADTRQQVDSVGD